MKIKLRALVYNDDSVAIFIIKVINIWIVLILLIYANRFIFVYFRLSKKQQQMNKKKSN